MFKNIEARTKAINALKENYDSEVRAAYATLCVSNPQAPAWKNWEDAIEYVKSNNPQAQNDIDALPEI